MESTPDMMANRIADAAASAGMRGAVVALDGSVSSAVAAALCKRAFGERVLAAVIPCEGERADEAGALLVAARLDLTAVMVRLDKPFAWLVRELDAPSGPPLVNLRERLRMAVLRYLADFMSYIVVGAGARAELMAGTLTDGAGADVLPLGQLSSAQVRALAGELAIPREIIEKPAGAEERMAETREGGFTAATGERGRAAGVAESARPDAASRQAAARGKEKETANGSTDRRAPSGPLGAE